MLSFASKMMGRVACAQPPLLLQQRLLTTTSSVLGKNSKAPLRPVATHSTKLAGPRSDAHTVLGAVRAMKTMMATAPSRVGQRAFYHTPQAAPSTVVDQLLAYMSANNYAAKKVKAPQSDKTEKDRSKSSKETLSPEEKEVEGLKKDFFETFEGFEFDLPQANEAFTEYGKVWRQWTDAVPVKVKKQEGPITLEVLQKNKTNVKEICERFMQRMDIKVPSKAQLLEATLFLLERSLQPKFYLGRYLEGIKEEVLTINKSNRWGYLFPCPIACAEEQKQALEEIHVDVEEDCPERKEAVQYFDTSRNAQYALFIGGEIGSGKTHLALNMYTMYKRFFVKSAKAETEKKLYNDTNSHLTVYIKLGANARAEYEDVKNANKKMQGPIEGPDDEEKQRKLSMARNKDVTDLVCKLMCKAVNIDNPEALERLQSVPDPKAEHGDDPKDPMFHATFVVLDKVMLIPDVIKACSPSKNVHELLEMIRKRGMQKFFGTIYIVCVDSSPAYYYPRAGSFEESVITIQMRPSPNLFNKLTEEVRDIQDKKNGDQQRIYNVTHAQLLLAVSSYGTNTIALNTPETYEYLCGSMLLFFLNAFARHPVQLEAFIKMFDTEWKDMGGSSSSSTETPAEGKKGLTLDLTQTGDVLFPSSTMRFPYIGEEATPVEDTVVFKSFCESLQSYAQNAPVCVMCPPQSPFADCFIVAGKCLFLIQCKHTEKVWASNTLEVVKELRKMGFECEVTPKAKVPQRTASKTNTNAMDKQQKKEQKKTNSLLFVGALKEALKLERVIPVFCGTAGIDNTCSEIKARGYGWDVHPMIFNPSISLTAKFTRKRNETNWTFHGTKMIPFMGRKRF